MITTRTTHIDDIPTVIVVTTMDLVLTECNEQWEREFCADNKSSLGRSLNDFATPATRIFLQTHILPTLLRDGIIEEIYVTLCASNRTDVPVLLYARTDGTGGHQRVIWSIFSAQERRKLEVDILRRKQAAEEMTLDLERIAKDLKRSNEALSSFTKVVTHDLKAPARHVWLFADLLEKALEDTLTDEVSELLDLLKSEAKDMARITDDLHRYSLVGTNHGEFATLELASFLEGLFQSSAIGQSFKFAYEGSVEQVDTLTVPFELVVRNLINNAIKHHDRDDGLITASITHEGDHYRLDITDDGPGIAPENHDLIFGEFNRLPSGQSKEGSGLGLAMVKRTAENYGGRISVQSSPGEGARFSVYWPLAQEIKRLLDI